MMLYKLIVLFLFIFSFTEIYAESRFVPGLNQKNNNSSDWRKLDEKTVNLRNPTSPNYIQRFDPLSPGYVQDNNPLSPGYIQDIDPFSPGYVEDKRIFGFRETLNSFGNPINDGIFGNIDKSKTDIFGNNYQEGFIWNPYDNYSRFGKPVNNDGIFGGSWQSFGNSDNQTFGITNDKTFGGGVNQTFGGSSNNTFGGSNNTFGNSFYSD